MFYSFPRWPERPRRGVQSRKLGTAGTTLRYIDLPALVELKLAAGRLKDKADVVELIRANLDEVAEISEHLSNVHPTYESEFNALAEQAKREDSSR